MHNTRNHTWSCDTNCWIPPRNRKHFEKFFTKFEEILRIIRKTVRYFVLRFWRNARRRKSKEFRKKFENTWENFWKRNEKLKKEKIYDYITFLKNILNEIWEISEYYFQEILRMAKSFLTIIWKKSEAPAFGVASNNSPKHSFKSTY